MSLPRGQSFELRFPAFGLGTVFLYSQATSFSFLCTKKSAFVLRFSDPLSSPSPFVLGKSACMVPECHL